MPKFEQNEMMKKRAFTKKNWYDWLISYISYPIKHSTVLKVKIMGLFKKT